jgi:hypothetical protein
MQGGSVVFEKKIIKYEKQQFSRIGVRGGVVYQPIIQKKKGNIHGPSRHG